MTKLIINCETGKESVKELTQADLAQQLKDQENHLAKKAIEEAKAAQRQLILDKLGLTADEAKLLLS
jgi:hypothetical protein